MFASVKSTPTEGVSFAAGIVESNVDESVGIDVGAVAACGASALNNFATLGRDTVTSLPFTVAAAKVVVD